MKSSRLTIIIALVILFTSSFTNVSAQTGVISGKVTDSFGTAIPGVSLYVKETSVATITDLKGNYSIKAKKGQTLVITYVGYSSQEIRIDENQNSIDIVLNESSNTLHGWCCTDHQLPDGPHCGKDREELKRTFHCTKFIADN